MIVYDEHDRITTMKIPKRIMASPDKLCAYCAAKGVRITVRKMKDDKNCVLIEGDAEALAFLGHLLISQAEFQKDCGFQLSPKGAGRSLFNPKSDTGIYIHRLPCLDGDVRKKTKKL
jgi:hypothetical protein